MDQVSIQAALEAVKSTLLWSTSATLLVMIPGVLLAYALARFEFFGKHTLSTLMTLPMVLPPTAVGYMLLSLFADSGWLGKKTIGIDLDILLNWKGVIIACAVMSAPLVIRTARVSFEAVNPRFEAMARTLGRGRIHCFFSVTLPLAARGLLAALILGFTRSMGEFGATVILAGNIPGRTRTLASAIYSAQQSGNHSQARILLIVALFVGFAAVFSTEWLSHKPSKRNRNHHA